MPSFLEIGLLVPEKKILKGFYHILVCRPCGGGGTVNVICQV